MQLGKRIPTVDALLSDVTRWNRPTERTKGLLFDRAVSRRIRNGRSDIFVGFAGSSLRSIREANGMGATTIVERCSSHIRTQAQLLTEEYQRHGHEWTPISDAHIRREEQEYEEADYVSVPSTFVYDSFIDQGYPEEKLLLEPYAVDVEQFMPRQSSDEITRFLFAGGVGFRKGIPDLLSAWEIANIDNAELLIAGSVQKEVSDLATDFASNESVKFLGWRDDIDELYQRADAFVFPSIEEGSAYVTYEAMAAGLPLITTPNSGWVGEEGEHGIEVPIRTPDAVAEAIQQLHRNPSDRREMGEAARELAESEYTWDRYGERIFKRYSNL